MPRAKAQPKPEVKANPVKPTDVKKGHIMSFTYWGEIESVSGDHLYVKGLDNGLGQFQVHGVPLIEQSSSADQFHETVKASMTEVAEKLINSPRRPLTVCFDKADGTPRVMRCRLLDHEALLGRSRVEDLEQPEGDRIRLVDHRTVKWLIVDGTRYEVGRK